jgi:hypothetical protein
VSRTSAFNRAKFRGVRRQNDRVDARFLQGLENFLAPRIAQVRREKTAIADDDTESDFLHSL